jgi:hypothetical protein
MLASMRAAFRQVGIQGWRAGIKPGKGAARGIRKQWGTPQSFVKPTALKRLALNISGESFWPVSECDLAWEWTAAGYPSTPAEAVRRLLPCSGGREKGRMGFAASALVA